MNHGRFSPLELFSSHLDIIEAGAPNNANNGVLAAIKSEIPFKEINADFAESWLASQLSLDNTSPICNQRKTGQRLSQDRL